MKTTSGGFSDYQIRATATKHDSAKAGVGHYMKESFLVGERNLLEVRAVAVRAAQVWAGHKTELGGLRPNGQHITFCGSHGWLLIGRLWSPVLKRPARLASHALPSRRLRTRVYVSTLRDSGGEPHDS